MGRPHLRPFAVGLVLSSVAAPAPGQGSSVHTQSACVSAQGAAAVAAPCADGSAIYYNPAALALLPSALSAGFTAVHSADRFTYDTIPTVVERDRTMPHAPHAYAGIRFGGADTFAAGIGIWAPYGLAIEWPDHFEGRFVSRRTELRGLYVQPTIAWQVVPGRLAVGAGPQLVLAGIELDRRIDAPVADRMLAALGVPLGTDIARAEIEGTGTGLGGHVGAYYRHGDRFAAGARYMHRVRIRLRGDATFRPVPNPGHILIVPDATGGTTPAPLDTLVAPLFRAGGPLADRGVAASLTFPAQAVVGVRLGVTPALAVTGDYQWTGWRVFDELRAEFEGGDVDVLVMDYRDAHTLRLGTSVRAAPGLELRGGFSYNTPASPPSTVTPILPEAERHLYGMGAGYRTRGIRLDVFYNYVNQADRRGRVRDALPAPSPTGAALNVGVYRSTAHLFGVTLSYHPGEP